MLMNKKVNLNGKEFLIDEDVARVLYSLSIAYKQLYEIAKRQCEEMGKLMGKNN